MSRMSSSKVYRVEVEAYAAAAAAARAREDRIIAENRRRCPRCERADCSGHDSRYGVQVWWAPSLQAFVSIPED